MKRELGLVLAGFAAFTVVFTWPVAGRLTAAIPAGLADPLLNAWTLSWGAERLGHGLQGFWTPPAFYPYHGTLAYSENLLGIAVLVAPLHWIARNPVLTYNIAFLLSFVIAAAGMYLLARELTGRRDAAVVAAAFYAFCPYRAAQVTHLQVLMSGWLPIALWALHRFLATVRPAMLALFVGAYLLQALSNTYSLVFSLLPVTAVVAWAAWARQGSARAYRLLAAGAAGLAAMLLPVALAYRRAWENIADTSGDVLRYSADLASYFQVTPRLWSARWLPGPGPEEGNYFPGFTVVVLAGIALIAWWRASSRTDEERRGVAVPYVVAGLVAAVLSLGPAPHAWGRPLPGLGWLYQLLLNVVPGFTVFRVPARFGTIVMLALAVVVAVASARLLSRVRRPTWAWTAALLLAGAVAAEGYAGPMPTSDFALFRDRDEQLAYNLLRHRPPAPMLELPVASLGWSDYSLVYQSVALFHRHPIVNGFSRVGTPLQGMLGGSASPFADPGAMGTGVEMLRAMGVEYLVIHPALYRDKALAARTIEVLREDAKQVLEAQVLPGIGVFRLSPLPDPPIHPAAPVPAERISPTASARADQLRRALDGDVRTRWTSGRRQEGTEWVALAFDTPRDVARLDLVFSGRSLSDYPRNLEIEGIDETGRMSVLWQGSVLPAMGAGLRRDPERVDARLLLPANRSTSLRLRQLGSSRTWYWSIDDVRLWERR